MKLFLAILLILMLGACERKETNALQNQLAELQQRLDEVTKQRALLDETLSNLQTQLNTLQNETP